MIIPAGQQSSTSVDLPVGRYLFEAYLPSGEIVTETVRITDAENSPVRLRGTDSPHEWLSWQNLATRTSRSRARTAPVLPDDAAHPTVLEVITAQGPVSKALLGIWKGGSLNTLAPTPMNVTPRPGSGQPLHDGALGVTAYLYEQGPWQDGQRYFGLVRQPPSGPALLAVLPLPWHQADMSGDAAVDVLVDASGAGTSGRPEWPVTVSVVVRDNVMGPVFGYLSSGDLPSAAQVVETAVDRLAAKFFNALAAAGAAYILVRSASETKTRAVWVPWLANLRNYFPSLADGAILDGWAHLNGIGRPRDVSQAAMAFVQAVDRGLPLYTAGVRLLFDGMTRAAVVPKQKLPAGFDDALEVVRRLALHIDVRQTFTVVRLG